MTVADALISLRSLTLPKNKKVTAGKVDWLILLGAPVNGPVLSQVLMTRIDAAHRLLLTTNMNILVTGDDGRFRSDEVGAMAAELMARGHDSHRIVIDGGASRTLESLQRASTLYDISRAVIVTSDFHMRRAVFLAREVGIAAVGAPATSRTSGQRKRLTWWVRERFSVHRAIFDIARMRLQLRRGRPS